MPRSAGVSRKILIKHPEVCGCEVKKFKGYKWLYKTSVSCWGDDTFAFHSARFIRLDVNPRCVKQSSHLNEDKSAHLKVCQVEGINTHLKLFH